MSHVVVAAIIELEQRRRMEKNMSAKQVYRIVCDGCGATDDANLPRATETRAVLATRGWTRSFPVNRTPEDLCPKCPIELPPSAESATAMGYE